MAVPTVGTVQDLRFSRVESVSDEGEVVLRFPDGDRVTITVPLVSIPQVRRLAEIDAEIEQASHRRREP